MASMTSEEMASDDVSSYSIDPLGQPTVTVGRDHCSRTCHPSVRPSVPNFQILAKQTK